MRSYCSDRRCPTWRLSRFSCITLFLFLTLATLNSAAESEIQSLEEISSHTSAEQQDLYVFENNPEALYDSKVLIIQPPRSNQDGSYQYYRDLLLLILNHELLNISIEIPNTEASQRRSFQMLEDGSLDIVWAGTSETYEKQYRAIKVPLYGGLLGLRLALIRRSDKAVFDVITDASQLKSLSACQSDQWADADILEDNGYLVERAVKFSTMHLMLSRGRCDYFPRGITEAYNEAKQPGNENLMVYERIALYYHFHMYFFVEKENEALAMILETRLQQLAKSGELLQFMQQHPVTKTLFPLERYHDLLIFKLDNSYLANPETDLYDWLDLSFLNALPTDAKNEPPASK
ncbi:MAG: transporter substrate-binding domain-containing protein [Oleibacter sp.]|nr:transporter substrate-binding domain-containing protein [Thalassolituus sp.]